MEPVWLAVTLLFLSGLALMAWSLRALDLSGALSAFLLGLWVALAAGILWLVLMTLFTVVGVLATAYGRRRKAAAGLADEVDGQRSWRNVIANGAAAAIAALAFMVVGDDTAAALAFATAIAAVTADTMASEVGCLAGRARSIMPPFGAEPPGTNGAVSLRGQVAALSGAAIIAAASVPLLGVPAALAWVPALGGFAGCQIDSVLGATMEQDHRRDGPLSKQGVNFLASLLPTMAILTVFVFF